MKAYRSIIVRGSTFYSPEDTDSQYGLFPADRIAIKVPPSLYFPSLSLSPLSLGININIFLSALGLEELGCSSYGNVSSWYVFFQCSLCRGSHSFIRFCRECSVTGCALDPLILTRNRSASTNLCTPGNGCTPSESILALARPQCGPCLSS